MGALLMRSYVRHTASGLGDSLDAKLLDRYLKYAASEEAYAVLFVKKHLAQAKGHWVDIVDRRQYEESSDPLHFRFVTGDLYKRRLTPKYPSESAFTSNGEFREREYRLATRAITWETAHRDIEQQRSKRLPATRFEITGVSYDRNRHNRNCFIDGTQSDIMALADNPNDRTDPLWATAVQYLVRPEFVYKIKKIDIA